MSTKFSALQTLALTLGGVTIVETPHLVIQNRFPRSKKRRIQTKWKRRPENFKPHPSAIMAGNGNVVYMHPKTHAKLAQMLAK